MFIMTQKYFYEQDPQSAEAQFDKYYAEIMQPEIAKMDEERKKYPNDPDKLREINSREMMFETTIKTNLFEAWLKKEYGVKDKLLREKKGNDTKGAEANQRKRDERKKVFCKIYREEKAKHGSKTKKLSLLTSAIERFKNEHGEISERTARQYLKK